MTLFLRLPRDEWYLLVTSELANRHAWNPLFVVSFAGFLPKAKPPINVVGDVGGKIAIIVVRFE